KTQSYDFTTGSSNDKSGVLFNVSYTNQDGIFSKDRSISKEPVIGLGNAGGSSAIPNGRFVFVAPSTSPWFNFCGGATCDLTIKDGAVPGANGKLSMNDFRTFVSGNPGSDRFNYAPYNYVLTPEERYSGYVQGYTDLADNITFKADFMYSHRDSHQQSAPEPLFFASSSIAIDIPSTQKYNPFGFDLNAADPANANLFLFGRRMVENGPRLYHEKEDTFHVDMGFTGFFEMGGKEWDWDANYAFSKDTEIDVNDGHFDVSHLKRALGDAALCTDDCVQLNIFGGANAVTQKMLDYIRYTAQNQFENNQRVYNLDLTQGDLFELPGGGAGLALGFESLEHDGIFLPDSVAQQGNDSFNPGRPVLPTTGRESSQAEYAELDLPVLGNMTGIKLLDLDLAARHTKYDVYGTSNTYRWGLKYQPNDEWVLRASWSQGFRAPSIQELFSAGTNFSANIVDPCDKPTTSQVCTNQGIPSTYTQPNAQINTLEIGNRNLQPETSVSRTYGFVYNPDWLAGFSMNMDYYKIEVDNVIQPLSGQTILDSCYTTTAAASDPAACALVTRTAFGAVQTLKDAIINAGTIDTSGIDINLTYALPSSAAGDFKITFDDTHIRTYDLNGVELAGVERGGSVFPFGVPRDKARLALDWSMGGWSAEYALRYVRSMVEESNGAPTGVHIGATVYHDVQASYDVDSLNTTFTLGIRNLWDKQPPSSTVQELNNFDPTLYDVPGRFVYGRIGVKF
ncbi:MAG TPA: TonB-dependent receptor, partial [Gammaproteobacteria bacterium]